jgi:hypothetical protein
MGAGVSAFLAFLCGAYALLDATPALAQPYSRWELGAQAGAVNDSGEGRGAGIGGRLAWHWRKAAAIEGIVNFFLSDRDDVLRGGRKIYGLAGPKMTYWTGTVGFFGKGRVGFARVGEGKAEGICIAIFPPPASCFTADTRLAFDVGGGLELQASPRLRLRVEAGDVFTRGGRTADLSRRDEFVHALEIVGGAGIRF